MLFTSRKNPPKLQKKLSISFPFLFVIFSLFFFVLLDFFWLPFFFFVFSLTIFFQPPSPFHWVPHRILRSVQKTLHLIAMKGMSNALELILRNMAFDGLKKTRKHALSYLKNRRLRISSVELCNKLLKLAQKRQ